MTYAGFLKRAVSHVIDWFIILLCIGALGLVMGVAADAADNYVLLLLFYIPYLVGPWLYYAYMESSEKQGTIGKIALGIKVVDLDGNRVTFARATGRFFAKSLSALTLGIGYFMAGWTQRKQALHDMVAHCLVVNR